MHMFQLNNGSFFTYAIVSIIRSKGRRFGPVTRIRRNPPPNETMNSFDKQESKKRTQRYPFLFLSLSLYVFTCVARKGVERGGTRGEGERIRKNNRTGVIPLPTDDCEHQSMHG